MKIRELLENRFRPGIDSGESDWDYADRQGRSGRRGEPDDSYRSPSDYSDTTREVQAEIEQERRMAAYRKKFEVEQDWQAGNGPNTGKEYNLRYIVTSDDPAIIKNELDKFERSHDSYMRKLVDQEILPGKGISYYMDKNSWNHPVKPKKESVSFSKKRL